MSVKGLGSEHVRQSDVCGDVLHVGDVEYPFPRDNSLHLFFKDGKALKVVEVFLLSADICLLLTREKIC